VTAPGGRDGRNRPRGPARPPGAAGPRRRGPARSREPGPGNTGEPGPARTHEPGPARTHGSGSAPRARAPRPAARRPARRVRLRRPGLRRASSARRLHASLLCVGFALSLVAGRLVQLQGLEGAAYSRQAANYKLRVIKIPAERGTITTADGTILAMTVQEDTVTADPPQLTGTTAARTMAVRQQVAGLLAGPLHMTTAAILGKLYHPSSRFYVELAQGLPAPVGNRLEAELTKRSLAGIYFQPTYIRSYPNGDLASGLVGFTTTNQASGDITGQAGIEQSFNSLLAGRDGQEQVETGITGQPIPFAEQKVRPLVPGGDVRLTILASLQWEAQQACEERVRATHADNCTIVVEQPSTGKILALAQYPTYTPGHVTNLQSTVDLPVNEIFPPGSTAKVITAAAALEHGQTPLTPYTVPAQITIDGFSFHDAEWHPTERLTLAGIVAHSSNVGMVQVAAHVSPQVQDAYYRNFGVGVPTGLPLTDAGEGDLLPLSKWWGDERYELAFGQGVAVTAVQMAGVYSTIANHGVRVSPSVVAGTTGPDGKYTPAPRPHSQRVIQPSTATELVHILQQVPYLDYTIADQPWGEIPGYSIASKTGTAQAWDPKAGCLCRYGSSYIGMAPATDPKVVVAVNIQNPKTADYYGNYVAGPAFYSVMKFALATLKIPPDHGKRPDVPLTAR
jgi:cell division protein FtsI (penicillin-binding protein 3)